MMQSIGRWFGFGRPEPKELRLSVQFLVEADGEGFHAFSPVLPGLHADGETEQEAVHNFIHVVPAYFISILKHGEPLPVGVMVEVREPGRKVTTHSEEIVLPWLPPSVLESGTSLRA
jgi:predicted RNase H-like HicB family nuclease